jgi:cation:H+ antiporter
VNINIALWLSAAGLLLLALGGEAFTRGGIVLKRAFEISPVIIGLFALSLGTSSPVLAIALQAATTNTPDVAVGVVIGATLINLLLILGLGALIRPMSSAPKVVLRDGGALLLASAALVFLATQGVVSRRDGVLLIAGFVIYAVIVVITDWRRAAEHSVACAEAERRESGGRQPTVIAGAFALFLGVLCLVIGAHFTVGAAQFLGVLSHLPLSTVALTAVAFGASLPVLAVTAIAAARGHTGIAIGHLIVASVFDLLGALGVAALVRPLPVSPSFAAADAFVVLGAGALLLPLLSGTWRLSRLKGAVLMLGYIGYLGFLAWREGLLHGLPGLS